MAKNNSEEPNSKFLKKNAVRVSKYASIQDCFKKAQQMAGSEKQLKHQMEVARVQGYRKLMQRLTANFHMSVSRAVEMLSALSQLQGPRKDLFKALMKGLPITNGLLSKIDAKYSSKEHHADPDHHQK